MGRLSQLAGRRREDKRAEAREEAGSERTRDFDRSAEELREAISALRADVGALRERAAERAAEAEPVEGEVAEQSPLIDEGRDSTNTDSSPAVPEVVPDEERPDEPDAAPAPAEEEAALEAAHPEGVEADETAVEVPPAPTADHASSPGAAGHNGTAEPSPDEDPAASAGGSGSEGRQGHLLGRMRPRLRRSRGTSVVRACMVCGSTFEGTEDELKDSGGKVAGDLYICASCQRDGWSLPV